MKKFLLIFSILIICAVAFFIFFPHRSTPWEEWVQKNVPRLMVQENSAAVAIAGDTHETEPELEPEWEKWVDDQTEQIMEKAIIKKIMEPDIRSQYERHLTPDEMIAKLREAMLAQFAAKAQELKNEYSEPPQKPIDFTFNFEFDLPRIPPYIYEGPQTPEALMEIFDEKYGYSEMDAKYPRTEWLQMFVDNGYHILDYNDYSAALDLRMSVAKLENDPEQWASGSLRIPPTDDWETYKAAYIERKVSMFQRFNTATRENPEYTGGFIPHSNPDVFLRYNGKRVYVMRNGLATLFYGRDLTDEQQTNLTHYGVHPQGIEVIYIDEDYNVLDERPPLITPYMKKAEVPSFITPDMLRNVELPPYDWKPPIGWEPPPGLEEALHANGWGGSFAPQEEMPTDVSSAPDNRLVQEVEKAAQATQEQFKDAQGEFEKFDGMSDAEIDAEFEKMLREQFPELLTDEKVDPTFREQFETKRFSPERFNRALDILDRHGPGKGLLRLKEVDPEVAAQVERMFFGPPSEKGPPPRE